MATQDIHTAEILNQSKSGNFMFAPVGNSCNVQIFEELNMKSCAELISHLNLVISQLPLKKPIDTSSIQLTTPYDVSPDTFVFDVAICCSGGEFPAYKSLSSMFAQAKARGAIVRTVVTGNASSSASMLAIQGTPGYRIMFEQAYNLVHYGTSAASGRANDELLADAKKRIKEREIVFDVYKKFTKLTAKEIRKFTDKDKIGKLFAPFCLSRGLCDWILTQDGYFVGRSK